MSTPSSTLSVAVLYPLSTAASGDEGNARVLAHRAALRGVTTTVTTVHDGPVPEADLMLLGGIDDAGMPELHRRLRDGGLADRVAAGAVVLAVNAGYQVLGREFVTPDGTRHDGLGVLDVRSRRASGLLASPVVTRPRPDLGLAAMSAYESHSGTTEVGPGATAFVELELGHGNDGRTDGAVAGHVVGTYLAGPVLARNADLADLLLGWALGEPLPPAPAPTADALRGQRLAEDRLDPTGWGGRSYGTPRRRRPALARPTRGGSA
jgi:CobQ-like glutamine amidotransferase family enzyme